VTVLDVDVARKRIGLSMKADPFAERVKSAKKPAPKAKQKEEPQGSMAEKLAMLKGKFR